MFGGAKDFCPNFPNLHEKTPKIITSKKNNNCISFHVRRIFSNHVTSSTIFAQIAPKRVPISPNLPKKHDLKKASLSFWVTFL